MAGWEGEVVGLVECRVRDAEGSVICLYSSRREVHVLMSHHVWHLLLTDTHAHTLTDSQMHAVTVLASIVPL